VKEVAESNQLSKYERDLLFTLKVCPDCKDDSGFLEGPHGGCSVNIMCEKCGSKFNVCPPLFAERIGGAHGTP
jgi:hypothetical protein